jgi:two-component system, cell cycle response regulator DivK
MSRILYVEDNDDNVYMLKQRLERRGFGVLVAGEGQAGVLCALENRPDLILLDLGLPGLDGWGAARLLKRDERTRAIPIIALSAHAMGGERERALAAGCDDYEPKPIDMRGLLAKIDGLLGARL